MNQYGDGVMEHFSSPRNVGEIKDADGVGTVGNPVCGDIMRVYIKVEDERIKEIKFKTFGCAAAIASGSVLTEMVEGKTVDEALRVTREQIIERLGGLPRQKRHCSVLAQDALKKAVEDYRARKEGLIPIRFVFESASLKGYLKPTPLAQKILNVLPVEAKIEKWGEEIYFSINLKADLQNPQTEVKKGDIAFWPDEGGCLCLFFGPTPVSKEGKILAYSDVEVVGSFTIEPMLLRMLSDGDSVRVEKV